MVGSNELSQPNTVSEFPEPSERSLQLGFNNIGSLGPWRASKGPLSPGLRNLLGL